MKTIYEDKWIRIGEWDNYSKHHKTRKFSVISKCSDCELGIIKYDTGWRRYIFEPKTWYKTIYSDRCEFAIGYFILKMNLDRGCKSEFVDGLIKELNKEFGKNWNGA